MGPEESVSAGQILLAVTLEGKVVSVTDGDTLTLLDASKTRHKIRLHAIDAPEKKQPFGQESKENLARLVFCKPVMADCPKHDRYRRQVCAVWVNTVDAGLAQITQGLAWHFKRYEKEQSAEERRRYAEAETEARDRKTGLWADKAPVPPWDWRASGSVIVAEALGRRYFEPARNGLVGLTASASF